MATANMTIANVVISSDRVPDPSGSGLLSNRRVEEVFSFAATTANYSTVCDNIGTTIFAYTLLLSGAVQAIHGEVVIQNVTSVEYATPRSYSTSYATATPAAVANVPTSEDRFSYEIGPYDYTNGPTLGAAIKAQVAKAVATTTYS